MALFPPCLILKRETLHTVLISWSRFPDKPLPLCDLQTPHTQCSFPTIIPQQKLIIILVKTRKEISYRKSESKTTMNFLWFPDDFPESCRPAKFGGFCLVVLLRLREITIAFRALVFGRPHFVYIVIEDQVVFSRMGGKVHGVVILCGVHFPACSSSTVVFFRFLDEINHE